MGATVATGLRLLAAGLLPVAVLLSHRNATVLIVLIGIAGLDDLRQVPWRPWALWLAAACAWAAVSCLWSPYGDALAWPAYLALIVVLVAAASRSHDDVSTRAFLWSTVITAALLIVEGVSGGIIRDIVPPEGRPDKDDVATARGFTIAAALLPAVALWVGRRAMEGAWRDHRRVTIGAGAAFLVLYTFASLPFGVAANGLAMAAAMAAAALAFVLPRMTLRLGFVAAALPFLLMPLLALALPPVEVMAEWTTGPASWRQRLIAWKAMGDAVAEGGDIFGFLIGHGVEAGRVLGERLGALQVPGALGPVNIVPTHPHNIYVQVWYDLGLVGVALCFASLVAAARSVPGALVGDRALCTAAAALLAETCIFALTDASLWTLWRVAGPLLGIWLLKGVALSEKRRRTKGKEAACPGGTAGAGPG